MEEKKGALVPVQKSKLPMLKETAKKVGKVTKYSLLTAGFGIASAVSIAAMPVLSIPAFAGLAYNGQKLLNNTMYKGYDDLAFVTRKGSNNTIKIFQDWTRNDITKNIKGYTDIEKAGFMQLQAIIGMSKFDGKDKKGNSLTYSTVSHGITRKTFKKLAELGYIENYQEQFKKDSRLIIPKLAFGNVKGLDEKVQMYDISFNLSNKELDITSQELQKSFPIVFGRKGLIQKRGYEIIPDEKGGLTYRIEKNEYTNLYNKEEQRENKLKETLKGEGVPTYEQQADNSKKFMENQKEINQYIQRSEEDKQL